MIGETAHVLTTWMDPPWALSTMENTMENMKMCGEHADAWKTFFGCKQAPRAENVRGERSPNCAARKCFKNHSRAPVVETLRRVEPRVQLKR